MPITKDSVLVEMQKEIPGFQIDPEWLMDNLTYPAFNDLARFICSEAEVLQLVSSNESPVVAYLAFLERALRDGDGDVHGMVFECIETLASCRWINQIKKYFGPETNALWNRQFSRGEI